MRDARTTKERIQRSALRLFVEKGVTETTIRDIARDAGFAEGTLYRHYTSKDELAWDLFATNFMAFGRELEGIQRRHRGLKEKLEAMIRHFCAAFDEDWVLFSYLLLSEHEQAKKVTPDMPNPLNVLREVVAAGMKRRDIPKADPDVAMCMVLGIILQVAVGKVYGRVRAPLSSLADTLTAACWRVLSA